MWPSLSGSIGKEHQNRAKKLAAHRNRCNEEGADHAHEPKSGTDLPLLRSLRQHQRQKRKRHLRGRRVCSRISSSCDLKIKRSLPTASIVCIAPAIMATTALLLGIWQRELEFIIYISPLLQLLQPSVLNGKPFVIVPSHSSWCWLVDLSICELGNDIYQVTPDQILDIERTPLD